MKNKDLFNKAMNNVHAPEELKNKTLEKIMNNSNTQENINNDTFKKSTPKKKNNLILFKLLSACAVFVMVFGLGTFFYKNPDILQNPHQMTE